MYICMYIHDGVCVCVVLYKSEQFCFLVIIWFISTINSFDIFTSICPKHIQRINLVPSQYDCLDYRLARIPYTYFQTHLYGNQNVTSLIQCLSF